MIDTTNDEVLASELELESVRGVAGAELELSEARAEYVGLIGETGVSEEPPVATAVVEEEVEPVVEAPVEPRDTAYSKKQALFADSLAISPEAEKEVNTDPPSFTQATGWMYDEMGVTNNLARGTTQFLEGAEEGDSKIISASMDILMQGVPEEYRDIIELQPSFAAAERESARIREIAARDEARVLESGGQMLATGVAGFVVDPLNWVPGLVLLKGMKAAPRLANMAGIGRGAETTLAKQAAVWTSFGGAEELIRGLPQLATDNTYSQEEYITMAIMAAGMTGAMPMLGRGALGLGKKSINEIAWAGQTMGSNAVYRRMVATAEVIGEQTASSKGILAKAKALDLAAVARESAKRAAQAIKDKVNDLPRRAFVEALEEVGDDAGKATGAVGTFFRGIGDAIAERSANNAVLKAQKAEAKRVAAREKAVEKMKKEGEDSPEPLTELQVAENEARFHHERLYGEDSATQQKDKAVKSQVRQREILGFDAEGKLSGDQVGNMQRLKAIVAASGEYQGWTIPSPTQAFRNQGMYSFGVRGEDVINWKTQKITRFKDAAQRQDWVDAQIKKEDAEFRKEFPRDDPKNDTAAADELRGKIPDQVERDSFEVWEGTPAAQLEMTIDILRARNSAMLENLKKSKSLGIVAARLEEAGITLGKFIGSGKDKAVFAVDGHPDIVVRIAVGQPEKYVDVHSVLKPTHQEAAGALTLEIMPRVVPVTKLEAQKLVTDWTEIFKTFTVHGDRWLDPAVTNMGKLPDGRIVIIDGEVVPKYVTEIGNPKFGKLEHAEIPPLANKVDPNAEVPLVDPRVKFDEAMDVLEEVVESAGKGENPNAGAAGRKTTAKDKRDDMLADLKYEQRMLLKKVKDAKDAAQAYLDESGIIGDPRTEIMRAINAAHDSAIEAVHRAHAKKGLRPQRTRLNNAQGTAHVGGAVAAVERAVKHAFAALNSESFPAGINVRLRGDHATDAAFKKAGIERADGETFSQAFERTAAKMSHVQRGQMISDLTNEMDIQLSRMADDIDSLEWKSNDQRNAAIHEIESARIQITNALDMANVVAANPYTDALVTGGQWQQVASEWRAQNNMNEIADQFVNNKLQSALKHQYAMLTNSLATRLMASEAPLAQWFTHSILETPSGFGGKIDRNPLTAAIYSENMFNAAKIDVARGWEKLMIDTAKIEGWGAGRRVRNTAGNAKTHADVQRISEEVMLEMNARNMGHESTASSAVSEFVDTLGGSYSKLHDLQNGHVAGIHAGNKIENYQHQVWDSHKLLSIIGTAGGRDSLEKLFSAGYVRAGFEEAEAKLLAKAIVSAKETAAARPRKESAQFGEEDLANAMPDLLTIVEKLRKGGSDEEIIQKIIEKMNKQGGADMPSYAKNRTPIDLAASIEIDGKTVRVVDLMDKDVPATFIRYAKEATGRRAISESTGGLLNSDKSIHDFLTNMALEAGDLGANVDVKSARIALQQMMGKSYDGQLPMNARRVRDAVSLAGMGGLGESQLAEFGLAINRGTMGLVGLMQKYNAMKGGFDEKFRGIELSHEQMTDRKLMSELQEVSGLYADMYLVDRQNIHFDAAETDVNSLTKLIDTGTGGKYRPLLQRLQGRVTGYGAIRQMEDQVAMASISQDIARFMRGEKVFSTDGRLRDLGVPLEKDSWLQKAFDQHVSYKEDGTVETLNLQRWSDMDKAKFGVILNRYASQQVQKGFIGESSPEMMNQWVAFMMQFKSYPMLAAEKQQARHLKFADKEAAMGIALNTVSSGIARVLRYQSMAATIPDREKRKQYLDKKYEDLGADTFKYMGIAGMLPSAHDSIMNIAGQGSPNYSIADEIPVLNYIDGVIQAAQDPLETSSNGIVARNTQSAAPLGTVSQMNILFRIMSEMTPGSNPD